ncbi:MAG TPA: hypothetical protein VMU21_03245 [Thermodesulfovibrionales bacterium]|nr:hypothetical protein [Thermodesulfovibrionales bacterium]
MNKVVPVIIAIALVLSFTGMTSSADKGEKITMVAGAVKAIDTKQKTITLETNELGKFTCILDDKTLLLGRKTIADVKVDDVAAVIYEDVNGKHIAKSITVASPAGSSSKEKTAPATSQEKK